MVGGYLSGAPIESIPVAVMVGSMVSTAGGATGFIKGGFAVLDYRAGLISKRQLAFEVAGAVVFDILPGFSGLRLGGVLGKAVLESAWLSRYRDLMSVPEMLQYQD